MANFSRVKPTGWALNEILTSAQQNALDIDHTKAPNFDEGSSHTPAADIDLTGPFGFELQGTLRLKYDARALWRVMPMVTGDLGTTGWAWISGTRSVVQNTTTGNWFNVELLGLPDGATLDDIRLNFQGASGHAQDPVDDPGGITMPEITLYRQPKNSLTPVLLAGPIADTVTTKALYEAAHSWTLGGSVGHTIDKTANRYYLKVESEGGADYITAAHAIAVEARCILPNQPEY